MSERRIQRDQGIVDNFLQRIYTKPMLASYHPYADSGSNGVIVEVVVVSGRGLPGIIVVGLPGAARAREQGHRI